MKHLRASFAFLLVPGCTMLPAPTSRSFDGKCHGPDYNAPGCVYLF